MSSEISWSALTGPELAGRLDDDLARGRSGSRGCDPRRRRCGRAAAGRPTSRRMRWEERSAERAASPWSPCSDSASSSRFASTLVSGVRSSWEASATKRRWRASIASVSPRAASSSRSIPSSVRASSATSSSACGLGDAARRVARARDLRGGAGQRGDRRHRPARDRHAGEQREHAAGEHAEQQEQLDALDRRLGGPTRGGRTGRSRARRARRRRATHRGAWLMHAVAVAIVARPTVGGPERRARSAGYCASTSPAHALRILIDGMLGRRRSTAEAAG